MTEEEKRAKALAFLEQEQQRLATSTFRDYRTADERDRLSVYPSPWMVPFARMLG